MPLGLGRSILSRYEAPAAGGGAEYYWTDEQDGTYATGGISSNKAAYILDANSNGFATTYETSCVFWFRCPNIESRGTIWSGTYQALPSAVRCISVYVDSSRIILHTLQGANAMTAFFVGPLSGSTRTDVFDGEWHQVMIYKDASETNPSNTSYAVWDGGTTGITTSFTNYAVYNTDARTMNNLSQLNFGFRDLNSLAPSTYNTANVSQAGGTDFDIGPVWIYDKKIDFSQQSVRDYYWDQNAADGFVDGGTDGTAGGAEQPAVYMYHDGTDWKNGGTKFASTATKITAGTGDITATNTDGPGTGATG